MSDDFHDRNVEAVAMRMRVRSMVGLRKYGSDTTRQDFDAIAWIRELQDELLDAAIYCEAALGKLEIPFAAGHPDARADASLQQCREHFELGGTNAYRCNLVYGHEYAEHVRRASDGREYRWQKQLRSEIKSAPGLNEPCPSLLSRARVNGSDARLDTPCEGRRLHHGNHYNRTEGDDGGLVVWGPLNAQPETTDETFRRIQIEDEEAVRKELIADLSQCKEAKAMGPKFKLGDKVRDTATGFEGVVTATIEYLNDSPGCRVENKSNPDRWISAGRLELQD